MTVPYGSRGALKKLRTGDLTDIGTRAFGVEGGRVFGEGEGSAVRTEILRHLRICEQTQGALVNTLLGTESASNALKGTFFLSLHSFFSSFFLFGFLR